MEYSINDIVQILQLSIVPTVLISGVGLLLLTLNNRMAHLLDRTRNLIEIFKTEGKESLKLQIDLLYRRSKILRNSVLYLVVSIFTDVLIILSVFVTKLFSFEGAVFIIMLFLLSLASLITGLAYFIHDVNLNLRALRVEMQSEDC